MAAFNIWFGDELDHGQTGMDSYGTSQFDAKTAERGGRQGREPERLRPLSSVADSAGQSRRDTGVDATDDNNIWKRRHLLPLIALLIAFVAAIGAGWYWLATRGTETTDDAYTDGNSISVASKDAGYVTELSVDDNTFVKAGQPLFKIDPRDYIAIRDEARANLALARSQLANARVNLEVTRVSAPANLQQAQAQLDQARAKLHQAELNYRRQHALGPAATTQVEIDQADAQLGTETGAVSSASAQMQVASLVKQAIEAAEQTVQERQAQVAQAEASLARAEINLSYTEIRAPQDGYVTQRNVDLGTYLQAGQQVFYLVTPDTWISANFKETQLPEMRTGQKATIAVDAYPDLKLKGHVDSIQNGSGAQFSAFPAENATGNWVKIVRRVPVKIVVDSGLGDLKHLPLGISAVPTVDVP